MKQGEMLDRLTQGGWQWNGTQKVERSGSQNEQIQGDGIEKGCRTPQDKRQDVCNGLRMMKSVNEKAAEVDDGERWEGSEGQWTGVDSESVPSSYPQGNMGHICQCTNEAKWKQRIGSTDTYRPRTTWQNWRQMCEKSMKINQNASNAASFMWCWRAT